MDCDKVGKLIAGLRREKGMTQKELADALYLSDRTVSKWECGRGYPDVSLLSALSQILGVHAEKILAGELDPNRKDGGNMRKIRFYVCPGCGNVLFGMDEADISCCGRKLAPLKVQSQLENHTLRVSEIEDEYLVTIDHDMSKAHYISFVASVCYDRVLLVKLYPEQSAELRIPRMRGQKLYACCKEHGLWEAEIPQ